MARGQGRCMARSGNRLFQPSAGPVAVLGHRRWFRDRKLNGPVTVRSPGRWPDTARSAAQASEANAMRFRSSIRRLDGPKPPVRRSWPRNEERPANGRGYRSASECANAGVLVAIVAQPSSDACAALRAVSGQRPGLRTVTGPLRLGSADQEQTKTPPFGGVLLQRSILKSPARATLHRPSLGAGRSGHRNAAEGP
jgi:hypothetical protein